jgi:aspartate-semialdehyde dehydrogenase
VQAVGSPVVFSALDAAAAAVLEPAFASDGRFVLSNAKNFRMEADVPLVIPEVTRASDAAAHVTCENCKREHLEWPWWEQREPHQ